MAAAAALVLIAVGRVHSFIPYAEAIRPAFIVTALAVLALLLRHGGARSPHHLLRHPFGYLVAFVFVWAVVGTPFGIHPRNSALFLFESFLRTAVVVAVIATAVRGVQDLDRLLRVYALGAVIFAVGATGTEGFRDIDAGGYDPNDSAMFIVAAIPLLLHFLIRARGMLGRITFGGGLLVCGSAIVLSGSRGGFVALVAVLGFCLLFFRRIRPWARAAVVAAVVGVVAFQASAEFWQRMNTILDEEDYNRHSITGRVEIWSRGTGYMFENPVFGVGIDNFPVAEGRHPAIAERISRGIGTRYSAAHSIWVQAGAELGIPGLIAYLALFGWGLGLLWQRGGRKPPRGTPQELVRLSELALPLMGLLIGVGVAGTFLSHAYTGLFWACFALTLAFLKVEALHARRVRAMARMDAERRGRATPRPAGVRPWRPGTAGRLR